MMQQTSIKSYQQTIQETRTNNIRNNIFEIINLCPGASRNDIQRIYLNKKGEYLKTGTITGRVNELIQQGIITAVGRKKDRLTNRTVQMLHPIRSWIQ